MMDIMPILEALGTSEIAFVAAFFIGLMMAISPCPMATNIAAISYVSKKIGDKKHTLGAGIAYTLGRALTYVALASLIVYAGLNIQGASLFLQKYGEILLGPFLLIAGLIMLGKIGLPQVSCGAGMASFKEKLSEKGYFGAFGLGEVFAIAFCPFSAVLFFGMLIPLSLTAGDGILIPAIFAFSTGLPVILFSFMLAYSASKVGQAMNKIQAFDEWMRKIVAWTFIFIGIYCIALLVI
jgi:cytochrome c biogenesis protein CcdA